MYREKNKLIFGKTLKYDLKNSQNPFNPQKGIQNMVKKFPETTPTTTTKNRWKF